MKPACRSFRVLLEEKLVGLPDPTSLSSLSWHEHLLGCAACRALFESEETLEVLLATLPEPNLPPEIKRRVLAALHRSRSADRALDRLLDRGAEVRVPAGLAHDVLARLASARRAIDPVQPAHSARLDAALDVLLDGALTVDVPDDLARGVLARLEVERGVEAFGREARLDALLERDTHVAVPAGSNARILAGLAPARRSARRRRRLARSTWAFAAAAVLVAALVCWAMWPKPTAELHPDMVRRAGDVHDEHAVIPAVADESVARAPDPKMLAAMDVLENMDLLMEPDVDVLLATTSEPADELLLEYQEGG